MRLTLRHLLPAYIITAVLAVITGLIIYLNLSPIEHVLVLHFDPLEGIDFFGKTGDIWKLWAFAVLLSLINIWLAGVFWHRKPFFSYLFSYFNIFIWILIFITVIVIISVN